MNRKQHLKHCSKISKKKESIEEKISEKELKPQKSPSK
jgi:hypothetical protein